MKRRSDYVVGVDLGATNIVSLLISRDGEVVARDTRETMGEKGKEKTFSQIVNSARNVIGEGERSGISSKSILGLGIGCPGPLNSDGGVIHIAPNIPGWIDTYLVRDLEDELRMTVFLENDANAAALGEWWLGAGRDVDN
ncbi:MAG: ROK family protein, partial [Actinobacteria bacterium]|nr:ROK family protein [Actinomycetota bacterium]